MPAKVGGMQLVCNGRCVGGPYNGRAVPSDSSTHRIPLTADKMPPNAPAEYLSRLTYAVYTRVDGTRRPVEYKFQCLE